MSRSSETTEPAFDLERPFHYENGFYLTSDPSRLGKLLAHYELYRRILELPGKVVECGVFKGASLIRFATYRNLLECEHSREVVGFDTFAGFPPEAYGADRPFLEDFTAQAGERGLGREELLRLLARKGIGNVELVAGDIRETLPRYCRENPQLRVALLHIDTDTFAPARTALELLVDRVVKGGLVVLDDYGKFPGETDAVDRFFAPRGARIRKLPFSHAPAFIEL